MIKYFHFFIFSFIFLFAETDFKTRQNTLQDVKRIIQAEESIARAYEQYILDNYAIPPSMTELYTSSYLGSKNDFISGFIGVFNTNFNDFTLSTNKLNYTLKDVLKNDSGIKEFYENNTLRKKTYFRNDKIYLLLEDSFAKHLYNLISLQNSAILDCTNGSSKRTCKENGHIKVFTTDAKTVLLMEYHEEKFKTGPIVITNDKNLQITREEFTYLPKGTILFDTVGAKYIQTISGIEVLK